MTADKTFHIDVAADFVCPWCHIGARSLFEAVRSLAEESGKRPSVRFRAYLLNPATPPQGLDREAHYRAKFPDPAFRTAARERLIAAAAEAGFSFDPAIPRRLPSTRLAHVLLRHAHIEGQQIACAEAIYNAYWEQDADLGDPQTLAEIASSVGLQESGIFAALEDASGQIAMATEAEAMRAAGVSGVPTYIVNGRSGFSGALAPRPLTAALLRAYDLSKEIAQ